MMTSILKAFWQEEDGQDMVEYALLLAFVALAAVALLGGVSGKVSTIWTNVNTNLANAATASS
ncbi:MAG: Flp family type IVb pilin [Acidobacteriaceae bacterium]|nr:Flp family type IVb pilin [Acidobacteriaceae bacterium]